MAEADKIVNVFELLANADPKLLEVIFEGMKPWAQAANGETLKVSSAPAPQPNKT